MVAETYSVSERNCAEYIARRGTSWTLVMIERALAMSSQRDDRHVRCLFDCAGDH